MLCITVTAFATIANHSLGYERVDLPLCKVIDTPFYIQGGRNGQGCSIVIIRGVNFTELNDLNQQCDSFSTF